MSADNVTGRRITRWSAAVAVLVSSVIAIRVATTLARRIGVFVGAKVHHPWLAGLLDALRSWWDGLGPGGQGLVIAGLSVLLVATVLILAPELVVAIPGLAVALPEGGAAGVEVVISATATTTIGKGLVGVGIVMSAAGATSGSGSGATPTDRIKEHLSDRDLDAARRELKGEVVARKPDGTPWDHVQEVQDAQRGLLNRIDQMNRRLGWQGLSVAERTTLQKELSEASKLLDYSEQFVPR